MHAIASRLIASFILISVAAAALAADANTYGLLLARLKGGDTSIDFQAIRYAYAESPEYSPYANGGGAGEALKALNEKNFDKAIAEAQKVLDTNYLSIDAHYVMAWAYKERGDEQKHAFHLAVYRGLRDSIARSGDGKTPATAFVVISVAEEYTFLGMAGLSVKGQALLNTDSGPIDAMTVADEAGKTQVVNFNISRPFGALSRQLEQPASPAQ